MTQPKNLEGSPKELAGQIAIVTGSSSGIGEEIARRLSGLGATVVVNSSSSIEAGQKVAESLENNSIYVQADIADKQSGQKLIDTTIANFGRLDILINNAGWTTLVAHHDLDALTDEIFAKTFGSGFCTSSSSSFRGRNNCLIQDT